MLWTIAVFLAVYALIATERIHKTVAALLGVCLILAARVVPPAEAFRSVDFDVLFLLMGMMIIVRITEPSGLFEWLAVWAAKRVKAEPVRVLLMLFFLTAGFSAVLDNVTTVLLVGPLTILLASQLELSPVPFLISQILASNLGGTATLIGDPPNIMIGTAADLSFSDFLVHVTPCVLVQLVIFSVIFYLVFRRGLTVPFALRARIMDMDQTAMIKNRVLARRCLVVLGLVMAGFLLHGWLKIQASIVALGGAMALILWTKTSVEAVFKKVEWETLFFFVGLFIIVGALVYTGAVARAAGGILDFTRGHWALTAHFIIWFSGLASGLVDNIPLVATFIPILKVIDASLGPDRIAPLWWALSLGACLGGNATAVGASANVVMLSLAHRNHIPLTFWQYLKYGIPFTLLSLAVSSLYIQLRYY